MADEQLRAERRALRVSPDRLNVVMADGSVRFMSDSIDGVAVKWLVGAKDGQPAPEF